MDIKEFITLFAEQFDDVDVNEIHEDTAYQELDDWSSLTAMSLIAMAKTQFGKTITGREVRSCKTVGDLYRLIDNK